MIRSTTGLLCLTVAVTFLMGCSNPREATGKTLGDSVYESFRLQWSADKSKDEFEAMMKSVDERSQKSKGMSFRELARACGRQALAEYDTDGNMLVETLKAVRHLSQQNAKRTPDEQVSRALKQGMGSNNSFDAERTENIERFGSADALRRYEGILGTLDMNTSVCLMNSLNGN